MNRTSVSQISMYALVAAIVLVAAVHSAFGQGKAEKSFGATVTDAQGVETEVRNLHFYWEEKVSETAFVPHELKQVPVKRGASTVNVKFDNIKHIDVKSAADGALPTMSIVLTNGKSGEFALAISGSFKGDSDFGEVEFPAASVKKIQFK